MTEDLHYILEGRRAISVADAMEWAKWFEANQDKKRVASTVIGTVRISTVFLGLNHNFMGKGKPLIFETMVFGGKHDEYQERYSTYKEAEDGHREAVDLVRESLGLLDKVIGWFNNN